jgi:hypothetical protein
MHKINGLQGNQEITGVVLDPTRRFGQICVHGCESQLSRCDVPSGHSDSPRRRNWASTWAFWPDKNSIRRTLMKRSVVHTNVLILSLVVILGGLVQTAYAAKCSTEAVAGDWSFTLTGTLIVQGGGVPVAATGRFTADRDGNVTGVEARSVGGGYADEPLIGSWAVNPDWTGTLTANIYESGSLVRISVATLAFDDNFKEARMVQKSLTLPDGTTQLPVVITLEAIKQ